MLQVLHKILAVIIAFVVLFSSLSFTIEKHVCMGEITNVSYFTSSEPCGMNMETHDFNNQNFQNEKCCNDIQQLISGNQNEQQALDKLEINNVKFILAYTYTYLNLFEKRDDISTFINTSPHILDRDFQVLYQTFLI